MTVQSSATSPPTSFAEFVAMLAIWLEIVPRERVDQTPGTRFQVDLAHLKDVLVVAMLSTESTRFV